MTAEFKENLQLLVEKYQFHSLETESGWTFTIIDEHTLLFSPYGNLIMEEYTELVKAFTAIIKAYHQHSGYLVFLADFSKFKKSAPDVRARIIEARMFRDESIRFIFYGMNYFVSTIAKVIGNKLVGKRMMTVKNKEAALEMAQKLIENHLYKKEHAQMLPGSQWIPQQTVEVGGKSYDVVTKKAWTYQDPTSDYAYRIDLIDKDILVSRPSGYIRYQNSVMANVLFDKVVNSQLEGPKPYYRIQDYTAVDGSENKARRDFTDYIINGIDRIQLLVFYGMNRTMRTVVRLGKLVHPALVKVRIVDTFEQALEMVIADKYKDHFVKGKTELPQKEQSGFKSAEEELADLKEKKAHCEQENARYVQLLFDRIAKITFGTDKEYQAVNVDPFHLFYDLFSAVQLLHEDYNELKAERDTIRYKLESHLSEYTKEIQDLKIENASKIKSKENFIRNSGHELSLSLEAVLNALLLLRKEEDEETRKSLMEIIKMASNTMQDSVGQLKSSLVENQSIETLSESMFNYRKNINQLIDVAVMGRSVRSVVFQNTVEEGMPTFVISDKRKLNQLLNIFLENALKYTSDGFIKVYTHVIRKTATQVSVRIVVEDSGIGMDDITKARIFANTPEALDRKIQSKGFGLLIAQNLASALGAQLGFESEKGVGSKFWVEHTFTIGYHDKISQMHGARDQRKAKDKKDFPFEGNRALLILDDDVRENLLEQILRKQHIETRIKHNYELFSEIDGPFNFVFVRLHMTGGKELGRFRVLKNTLDAKNDFKPLVYIAYVDSLRDPILDEYRKIGVDYYIQKAFSVSDVEELLDNLK